MQHLSTRLLKGLLAITLAIPLLGASAMDTDEMHRPMACENHSGFEGMHGMGHHGPFGGDMPMMHLQAMAHHLKLTEAQQDKIFNIMHEQAPLARENMKAMRKAHEELRELSTSANFDDAKLKAASDTIAKLSGEMTLMHARTHHAIYAILTPEQQKAMTSMHTHGEAEHHHN